VIKVFGGYPIMKIINLALILSLVCAQTQSKKKTVDTTLKLTATLARLHTPKIIRVKASSIANRLYLKST